MKPGFQFEVAIDDIVVKVFYREHFVGHYYGREGRRAIDPIIPESVVEEKVREALNGIVDIQAGVTQFGGVIHSRSTKLNMPYAVVSTTRGFNVYLTTMMLKRQFVAHSVRDYVIEVNPITQVRMPRTIPAVLREMVLADLEGRLGEIEDESAHHMEGDGFLYWVVSEGGMIFIDDAGWIEDTYEVSVS